ncbi:MAG: carnitinyl-CoA dehydratase CaiD [Ramlibacter sp.]|nr:carnitinyl-CoA dehydratase CaiD [Ramlibacter sp.]
MRRFNHVLAGLAAIATAAGAISASGAELAVNPIRIVVPFAAGGAADSVARMVGQQVAERSGKTVVIDNRPGAGSAVGTELASRAAPDGGTLLVVGNALIMNKLLRPNLAYDPVTSFEPVCMLVDSPGVVVVNASSEFQTLGQLIDGARANPGKLSYGAVGPASATQLAGEMLKGAANVDITYAPFPGAAPAITALLGNHITAAVALYSEVAPQIKAGRLRALAVTSRERFSALRDVPTVAESGYKDYEMSIWVGLLAPAKTSKETLGQLTAMVSSALAVPELNARLVAQELSPGGPCGADFGALIQRMLDKYGRVIKAANIKLE